LGKGGIGDSLAKKFSKEGYNVAMVARSSLTRLEGEIPNSKSYQCDAGDPAQVSKIVEAIQKDMGPKIDALMYNAGSGVFKPLADISYEQFESAWRVGPGGVFLWTKACLSSMGAGSSIGLTGATASWRGMAYTPAFASSKMATRGLAQSLARDLGPSKGIHVFHVVIDGIVTNDIAKLEADGKKETDALNQDDIADTYWMLHQQKPTCWTQETHVAAQGAFANIASI
jgi:NAD(P)-dependent dehydrogenase (short-subunit alcohol dehydrogenase family)